MIGLASDHAGYELKEKLKTLLQQRGLLFEDYGTHSAASCDYPDYAHKLVKAIEEGVCQRGVAVCGSGTGINITLNKHSKIRAALSWIPEIAALSRSHNDANVLVLPGRFIQVELAEKILGAFLATPFEGGRHQQRVDKIPTTQL
ncbi:MAG: ribose 5-phosphate isomerase B [Bacteroides sp.]|nr:ribose 5-phosphate isomerase B [Bacteroides sp.]